MLQRDSNRLKQTIKGIDLTLGAGALAGTFIPAKFYDQIELSLLKDHKIKAGYNSIDNVSDRDFVIEILSILAILGMHLSRLSEDMILWASKEFDFVDIGEAFCTGSSLMPQKKNPDVFELVRGYTGRLYGNLMNVLTIMKGLPLAYNRDMQHDKEPLFDSFEIIQKILIIFKELFSQINFKEHNILKQLEDESLYATDLADYLVQNGVAFKEAHAIIGKLIQYKYNNAIELRTLNDQNLQKIHPLLTQQIIKNIINPKISVLSKKSIKRKRRK